MLKFLLLLAIAVSFVDNQRTPQFFQQRLRHVRLMMRHDETIYPTILYRYFPDEFPENPNNVIPSFIYFIDHIEMMPFESDDGHRIMSAQQFWLAVREKLPEIRQQVEANVAEIKNQITELLSQPINCTTRFKTLLGQFCDQFAYAANQSGVGVPRTPTNGELFFSLYVDISSFRNNHFRTDKSKQCARIKYLLTVIQWCAQEATQRGIDVRHEDMSQISQVVMYFLKFRRKNIANHTGRYISRIATHFWSFSNNPNISILAKFLFNINAVPFTVRNASQFEEMMRHEFARQQGQNRNAAFVIGEPRAGPPFSSYETATISVAHTVRSLIVEAGIPAVRNQNDRMIVKYRDIFESLRHDYQQFENEFAHNANLQNAVVRRGQRDQHYRSMQVKAALTIMNHLTGGSDAISYEIDDEYLRRHMADVDVEANANLPQVQPAINEDTTTTLQSQQQHQHQYVQLSPQQAPQQSDDIWPEIEFNDIFRHDDLIPDINDDNWFNENFPEETLPPPVPILAEHYNFDLLQPSITHASPRALSPPLVAQILLMDQIPRYLSLQMPSSSNVKRKESLSDQAHHQKTKYSKTDYDSLMYTPEGQ